MLTKLLEFQRQTECSQSDTGGDESGTVVATESVVGETVGRDEDQCGESPRQGEMALGSSLLELGDADIVVNDVVLMSIDARQGDLVVEVVLWSM